MNSSMNFLLKRLFDQLKRLGVLKLFLMWLASAFFMWVSLKLIGYVLGLVLVIILPIVVILVVAACIYGGWLCLKQEL